MCQWDCVTAIRYCGNKESSYSDFQASCIAKAKSVLHTLMCSVSVVTVVFIHTMEDDQRNTLVHEGDTLRFLL